MECKWWTNVKRIAISASYAVNDIGGGIRKVISDLNRSLGSRYFLYVMNERTSFASWASAFGSSRLVIGLKWTFTMDRPFGFRALMLYHWATVTLRWTRSITTRVLHTVRISHVDSVMFCQDRIREMWMLFRSYNVNQWYLSYLLCRNISEMHSKVVTLSQQ